MKDSCVTRFYVWALLETHLPTLFIGKHSKRPLAPIAPLSWRGIESVVDTLLPPPPLILDNKSEVWRRKVVFALWIDIDLLSPARSACRMLQSLADSSSSAIEKRLAAVSERLKEIERRKAAVDDRQDDIDRLAFETIATMVDMQVRKLYENICLVDRFFVVD